MVPGPLSSLILIFGASVPGCVFTGCGCIPCPELFAFLTSGTLQVPVFPFEPEQAARPGLGADLAGRCCELLCNPSIYQCVIRVQLLLS